MLSFHGSKLERQLVIKVSKGERGRKLYPSGVMLRIHIMQLLYNLSDIPMDGALYEIEPMRRFAGLRLAGNIPDEIIILNFHHFVEQTKFGKQLIAPIQSH